MKGTIMGLDMYLSAEKYISGYRDAPMRDAVLGSIVSHPPIQGDSAATVNVGVGYWRKANAIHNWFVESLQDGEDKCEKVFVPVQAMMELVSICESLLVNRDPEQAAEQLPTSDGFFFGSTDYDEYYWDQLESTVEQLKPLIEWMQSDAANVLVWDFYYQASW